jgi:hypothetical protein
MVLRMERHAAVSTWPFWSANLSALTDSNGFLSFGRGWQRQLAE